MFDALKRLFAPPDPPAPARFDDLEVVESRAVFDGAYLDHLVYRVREREGGRAHALHRVVRLRALRYLPAQLQSDPAVIEKTAAALAGWYRASARADLVYLVGNMVDPPVGIVQCYGVAGVAGDLETAQAYSADGLAALEAALSNFRQILLVPPEAEIGRWLLRALETAAHVVTVVGHPDPRQAPRRPDATGQAFSAAPTGKDAPYAQQQAETLLRGMCQAGHEFALLVLASRLPQAYLARLLTGIAEEASLWKSRQSGTKSLNFGFSVPILFSGAISRQQALGYTEQESQSVSRGVGVSQAHTEGTSESDTVGGASTVGYSHTVGRAHTEGVAHTTGVSVTEGKSEAWGTSHSTGVARAHTETRSWMDSTSESHGASSGSSWSAGQAFSASHSESATATHGVGVSGAHGVSASQALGLNASVNTEVSGEIGVPLIGGVKTSVGASAGVSDTHTAGTSSTFGASVNAAHTTGAADATGTTTSFSAGGFASESHSVTTSHAVGGAVSDGITHSESWGTSHATGRSSAVTRSEATTRSSFDTTSEAWTESRAVTSSWARTRGRSEADATGYSESAALASAAGVGAARGVGYARGLGLSGGLVPSVGASKTYHWVDDAAALVGDLLARQEALLKEAVQQGGYLTDVYALLPDRRAAVAFESLVRQAFIGTQDVATAVQPRYLSPEEQAYIRLHASAFTPATVEERFAEVFDGYRHSTLLPPTMLAAYTAPALFEEGYALVSQEEIPRYAVHAEMALERYQGRGIVLGAHWSAERGRLTATPVVVTPERHFHTVFQGDTGTGKTEAAMRLALGAAMVFHRPVLVFEFGVGWRGLFDSPLPRARFALYQLYPGAPRPLRWPLLRVPRRVDAARYIAALVGIIANAGGMGERQISLFQQALRYTYLRHGVPVARLQTAIVPAWDIDLPDGYRAVREDEAAWAGAPVGTPLPDLDAARLGDADARRRLVMLRSARTPIAEVVAALYAAFQRLKNNADQQALTGVILRLERIAQLEAIVGPAGPAEALVPLEEIALLGPPGDQWGVTVIEGGRSLDDDFVKSAIFGLMLWTVYTDATAVLQEGEAARQRIEVFIEEGNKVLSGVETQEQREAHTPELFVSMWRDSRKALYLHPITQTISALDPAILASCGNAFFFQSKNPKDADQILHHLGRSAKGMHDLAYQHHIPGLEVGACIYRFALSTTRQEIEMGLMRPCMVARRTPTDDELRAWYGRAFLEEGMA